jgi:hypothetical protein
MQSLEKTKYVLRGRALWPSPHSAASRMPFYVRWSVLTLNCKSAALLAAIREYDANKWKVIGQKVGKPAKVGVPFPSCIP